MSVTFTVRIPRRLAEKMKRYSEINWSEVVRKSIEEYIERLEESRTVVRASELLEDLVEEGLDPSLLKPFDAETEEKLYREMGGAEWRRLSTIRAR